MNKKVVIIGAGPIGLYLAYKLEKAGLKDIAIYDPRAGIYTRPGHIYSEALIDLWAELDQKLDPNKRNHIKDIERILYDHMKHLDVTLERKKFARFNTDPEQKGVILINQDNEEEFVACDYIFDCTGSSRSVVHQINETVTTKPFEQIPMVGRINVKNHLLAYVKISKADFTRIHEQEDNTMIFKPRNIEPLAYAQAMEQLRALGWHEMGFPSCYGVDFNSSNKDKACLYFECPDNLPEEHQHLWMQTVINAITQSNDIVFEQLPPSKKYEKKPRLMQFRVEPVILNEVAYAAPNVPIIIPTGDAQADPNYAQAHGLKAGMERIDVLIEHIKIDHGKIVDFDQSHYLDEIQNILLEHQYKINAYYQDRGEYFSDWLEQAETYYMAAIKSSRNQPEQAAQFKNTLKEIRAQLSYKKALYDFTVLYKHGKEHAALHLYDSELVQIQSQLVNALNGLPDSFQTERAKALEILNIIANTWIESGNEFAKKQSLINANTMYERALHLYQHPLLAEQKTQNKLFFYADAATCKHFLGQNSESAHIATEAITAYPSTPELLPVKRKILSHLIATIKDEIDNLPTADAIALNADFNLFLAENQELINGGIQKLLLELNGKNSTRIGFFEHINSLTQKNRNTAHSDYKQTASF